MRKLVICLAVGTVLLGLTACSGQGEKKTETGQQNTLGYKELTDPRGKTLESTATGERNPKMVKTLFETQDVVVADYIPTEMGYAVDSTGMTDSTAGIQQALEDCYVSGGGTVYLPAGNYAISDTIYIPPFVTLRGDWQDPDAESFDGNYGTIISVWMEPEDKEAAGAFRIGGSAGVMGMTVYYPLQTIESIKPYPYTFFVNPKGSDYMLQTICNVTIINGYRGIGTAYEVAHEQLKINNVKGTFLKCGMFLTNSADVGTVKNVTISNDYWKNANADCMNAVPRDVIDDYTKEYTIGMKLGDLEWTDFNKVSIDGCAIGIQTVKGARFEASLSMYEVCITNCRQGVLQDAANERWGNVISKSYIEGGIENNSLGKLKLCDVEVVGDMIDNTGGGFIDDKESDLGDFKIDYDTSYVKPAQHVVVAELPEGIFTDAGSNLQTVVEQVAEEGGGVVYVPSGIYRFRTAVTVPAGVEIRGCSSVATRDQRNCSLGTIFLCYYGDDERNGPEDQAFITLAGENAGLNGVRIIYPENGAKAENLNTTYAVRGTAKGVYVVNSSIVAAAYGVDMRGCDNHYISSVMTTCYYNAFYLGGKGGVLTESLQNGTVLCRTDSVPGVIDWVSEPEIFELLFDTVLRPECYYIKLEHATEQVIYNTFAYGVNAFLTCIDSENTLAVNIGTDNLHDDAPQIVIDGGSFVGINVLRYNGYSYELTEGAMELYNRIAVDEVGERTVKKNK